MHTKNIFPENKTTSVAKNTIIKKSIPQMTFELLKSVAVMSFYFAKITKNK
jgi:hypothetical protein